MVVLISNGPKRNDRPSAEETNYDLAEFIAESEAQHSQWDIREEDVQLTSTEQRQGHHLQRIATWTMAGILISTTIFAISTNNLKLIGALMVTAAMFLTRLVHQGVRQDATRSKKHPSREPTDDSDDS